MQQVAKIRQITQLVVISTVCFAAASRVVAQQFDFPSASTEDPAALSKAMAGLVKEAMAAYHDDNRGNYLDNLSHLQMVAGQYADALKSLAELRALNENVGTVQSRADRTEYKIYAQAKVRQAGDTSSFDKAFRTTFREAMGQLDDRTSALVLRNFSLDTTSTQQDLDWPLQQQKGKNTISLADALSLSRAYNENEVYHSFAPSIGALAAADDARRYNITKDTRERNADLASSLGSPPNKTIRTLIRGV